MTQETGVDQAGTDQETGKTVGSQEAGKAAGSEVAESPTSVNPTAGSPTVGARRELSGDEFFAPRIGDLEELEIPELGGVVYIGDLSTGAVLDLADAKEGAELNQRTLELIAMAVQHKDGTPMFSEDQAKRLRTVKVQVYDRMAKAVRVRAGFAVPDDTKKGKGEEGEGKD